MHEVGEINTINMKYLWHLFCLMKVTDNAHYVALHLDFVTVSWNLNNQSLGEHPRDWPAGAPLTYFNDGGFEGFFWVWHFGQKGFFWVYERRRDFFGSRKQHRDFLGIVFFISSNQQ